MPPVLKGRAHLTDQEEEQAQKFTQASWPPPWELRHDCLVGPVLQAQDPPLNPTHALLQHPRKGRPLPYESQLRSGGARQFKCASKKRATTIQADPLTN
mmetsp:Transcript_21543/g.59705  ORF Transcript_21543/g.59705 Transcript_21543/m.59705 type:complete len:99 (+) Transcript_21543:217-513(+)|eukprot:1016676-Pelagomonas_calceolata.AAC.1